MYFEDILMYFEDLRDVLWVEYECALHIPLITVHVRHSDHLESGAEIPKHTYNTEKRN